MVLVEEMMAAVVGSVMKMVVTALGRVVVVFGRDCCGAGAGAGRGGDGCDGGGGGGGGVGRVSRGWRLGMLLNVLQCTGQPPQRII